MILKHRVSLDEIQMDELDDRINVLGVAEQAVKESITATPWGGRDGQWLSARRREYLDVNVRFSLRIHRGEMAEREAVMDRIRTWAAGGGWLAVNYKEGQRIRVVCAELPGTGDPFDWTQEYSILFRAYAAPWWQSATVNQVRKYSVGTNAAQILTVDGNASSPLDAEWENTGAGTATGITIETALSRIAFSGISVAPGAVFRLTHDEDGLLSAAVGETSVLGARTTDSSDDLLARPGIETVRFSASGSTGTLTLRNWGRWL